MSIAELSENHKTTVRRLQYGGNDRTDYFITGGIDYSGQPE